MKLEQLLPIDPSQQNLAVGEVFYNLDSSLTLTASEPPDAGNTLDNAQDLGLFSYSITNPLTIPILTEFQEVVGGDDTNDYFQFTLDNTAGVSVGWNSSETITVELLDNNGTLIKSFSGTNPFSFGDAIIFENLNAGTYYLHLLTGDSTVSNYDLQLLVGPRDDVDSVSQTPKDLGVLTATPVSQSDYVHPLYGDGGLGIQDSDSYSFTLTEPSVVDFTLTDGVGDFTSISLESGFGGFEFLSNDSFQQTVSYQRTLAAGTYEFSINGSGPIDPIEFTSIPAAYNLTLTATEPPNEPPNDLTLSNNTIDENEPINTAIGTFTTTDPDTEDTFTYSLVTGDGDTNNSLFTIDSDVLKTNAVFDFETEDTYSIRVQTTDSENNSYSEAFTININDVFEIILSPVETTGNTSLLKDGQGKLYAKTGSNPAVVIKNGNTEITEGIFPNWELQSVEVVEGKNQAIWQLNNRLQLWTLDNNWKRQSSSPLFALNSSEAFTQETNFQEDFNNDGTIGDPSASLVGTLALSRNVPNQITGTPENDTLVGTPTDDLLVGGLGSDTLTGGAGSDRFQFNFVIEGSDSITDFNVGEDEIAVAAASFGGGLETGTLSAEQFVIGTASVNTEQRFIYNDENGSLFFDRDGVGADFTQVALANLGSGLDLSEANIVVI
ncbi:cadherin domain-containing protein [Crocosphaera sp.]|uniref:cadherin domain-containing protein n=1 Tax=Crocosphaera sp. TaxID=2729996 RepID=UPI00261F5F33|nr:cadherin domain-containing protein [Crocosphaera sp.]MDJ0578556.1 cadherin domain-containing protein [Crocosphaera sp.]